MEYELSYLKDVTGESKVIDGIIITIKDSENDLKKIKIQNELIVMIYRYIKNCK